MKSKKAITDVFVFALILIIILFITPILLKVVHSVLTPFVNSTAIPEAARNASSYAISTTDNFFDYAAVVLIFAMLIMLFVSSYFVDVYPFFFILYIIAAIILFIMIIPINAINDKIFNSVTFAEETSKLPLTSFIYSHYFYIVLIAVIISAIILFGKMQRPSQAGVMGGGAGW